MPESAAQEVTEAVIDPGILNHLDSIPPELPVTGAEATPVGDPDAGEVPEVPQAVPPVPTPAAPSDMVNIAEIMAATGFDRNTLTRFLDRAEVRTFLGGTQTHPRYQRAALPAFQWILTQHRAGIKPGALAAMVSQMQPFQVEGTGSALVPAAAAATTATETALSITDNRKSEIDYTAGAIRQVADTLLVAIKEAGLLPVREDRTLTREEAADLLGCRPGSVGRLVPSLRPGVWSHVMIQDHLAEERAKAAGRAAARADKKQAKKAESR